MDSILDGIRNEKMETLWADALFLPIRAGKETHLSKISQQGH